MAKYRYCAVEYRQVEDGYPVFLFAAPCHQVTEWAGIPRKEEKEGVQTIGFQRFKDRKRLKDLSLFLDERSNIIANPILCAVKRHDRVTFDPIDECFSEGRIGWLTIEEPDYESYPLVELLKEVEDLILARLPRLKDQEIDEDDLTEFSLTSEEIPQPPSGSETIKDEGEDEQDGDSEDEDSDRQSDPVEFSSETHIEEFYWAVRHRRVALERAQASDRDEFAGFSKEALIDYLRSTIVVDGQHRLLGAQAQLDDRIETDEARNWQYDLLKEGKEADEVVQLIKKKYARRLGVALIANDDWAEHVFQFVVVNQKATPIPRALLSSIVATTLTKDEVERITDRLSEASIEVVDYRTITALEGTEGSPFYRLVKRGFDEHDVDKKLDWSVFDRLVKMFRLLRGAKYFHNKEVDFARNWGKKMLPSSKIVVDYQERGFDSPQAYWESEDGPWRDVFREVWTIVRDRLADADNDRAPNGWGYPKTSNLFNDVSLTILGTDFFAYLAAGRGIPLNSAEEAKQIATEWLEGAKKAYFARDYKLKGVKKSENAVKIKWSRLWYGYRENGYQRVPPVEEFTP